MLLTSMKQTRWNVLIIGFVIARYFSTWRNITGELNIYCFRTLPAATINPVAICAIYAENDVWYTKTMKTKQQKNNNKKQKKTNKQKTSVTEMRQLETVPA